MLGVEMVVVVETGGLLAVVPPPQPSAKLTRQSKASPEAARRYRLLVGNASKSSVASPASMLSIHHGSPPRGGLHDGRSRAGMATALVLLDGASVDIVKVAVADLLLLSVTDDGEIVQVAPEMATLPQLSATVLVLLDRGVIVSVVFPDWPAVITSGVELGEMLKSGIVTLTKTSTFEAA